jgi:LexA-binding, inner membrane-associated putative hydrolase
MPSPIGHALGGAAVAWLTDLLPGPPVASRRVVVACAGLAVLPDADLLLPLAHRTVTHSVTAVAAVALLMIVASAVTGQVNGKLGFACVAAYASHLLLDWLQADPTPPLGIQLLWPMSSTWFISGWDVFRGTERRRVLEAATLAHNAAAILQEIAILVPVAAAAWLVRVKALAGLAPEMARGNHPLE